MTFVNPAILWGLFAVSIPIIIHIFNLKKTRKIEFSTLMFLKEIQETKQKRIRLKQLLILLCRIAFIILTVMAFAGPFSKGFLGSISDRAPATVLILLDDSFSLNGRSQSGTDFENAKKTISELLNSLDNGDEIYFAPVSKLNDAAYLSPYKEKNSITDSLSRMKISDIRKTFPEILYGAKRILSEAKYPLKEIYFVTDGQSSMFTNNSISDENALDDRTRMSIILTSNRTPNNVSIDSIDIKTKIFAPGRNIKISVVLNNHNNFNIINTNILFTSGSYRSEKVVDLPAGSKTPVDFSFTPTGTGYISGKAELTSNSVSEDEIPNDNSRFVVFYVPDELKVLLVSPSESNAEYVYLALQSSEALTADSTGKKIDFYKITRSSNLITESLNNYNSVVIINKVDFTQVEAAKLKEFLEIGGGVIIYTGKDANINNYNEVLCKTLGMPYLPPRIDAPAVFEKVDFEHPVFEGVFKSAGKDIKLESPSLTSYISPQTGSNSQSLIKLNNGQNFLVQYNIGSGKMLMYGVTPDYGSSNFPEAGIFSPLTVRSVAFVSKLPQPKEAITGEEYYFNPADFKGETDTLNLSIFDGNTIPKYIDGKEGLILNLEKYLLSSSIYNISRKAKVVYMFPVNTNPGEAQTARMNAKEVSAELKENYKIEADVFDNSKPIKELVREARSGSTLWHYFMIGSLLFLAIEYFLAKSLSKTKK